VSQLQAEAKQRPILLVEGQRLDVGVLGGVGRFLAASYRPQEK
jgi:hypothetical protein